jgi:hypothetical protein
VAWRDGEDNTATPFVEPSEVLVYRWTGAAWESLGQVNTLVEASSPSLAIDSSDNIFIALQESDGVEASGKPDVLVKRYNGKSWEAVGSILDSTATAVAIKPALALAANGTPSVVWREVSAGIGSILVKSWNGSAWEQLGDTLNKVAGDNANMASIDIDASNRPVVAWQELSGLGTPEEAKNIFVKRWTGTAWIQLGGAIDNAVFEGAQYPKVAVDLGNVISVVWNEGALGEDEDVLLSQWRNDSWNLIGQIDADTPAISFAYSPDVAIGADGKPVIAWFDTPGTGYTARVAIAE